MSDILAGIAAYKREEVRLRRAACGDDEIERRAREASAPRGFREALEVAWTPGRLALIAEIKRASPSRGVIRADFDPAYLARAYAAGGAACLSVLTDTPSFMGDDSHLVAAREACALPCLRKEFLLDPWQVAESRALGADAILVILALADDVLARELLVTARTWGMDVLVETHSGEEVRRAVRLGASLIGVNNRDLKTFVTDLTITEAMSQEVPANTLLVTESGIFTPADVTRLAACGARAMLVGEALMRAADVAAATAQLTEIDQG